MSPIAVWTLVAAIGICFDLWNAWWAYKELRGAQRGNGSGLRLLKMCLGRHNLGTEIIRTLQQLGALYVGIKVWGAPGGFNEITNVLIGMSAGLTINAMREAFLRRRLDLLKRQIADEEGYAPRHSAPE